MSDEQVIRHCAPTLASIKTANLFSCAFAERQQMLDYVRQLNVRMQGKGVKVLPLRYRDGLGLIYVFRPARLSRDLQDCTACRLLRECGYPCTDENACLRHLMQRLNQQADFPHEIGLFLGYPPEDVDGFISRRDQCKCCGYWKVYGDVDAAKRTFACYRKCSDVYWRLWRAGRSMERLTVAV
ncbi:MAG: DUF3793 family protein [Clostridia bacterium]|nr:DUF3793 family protein [Clostridia bacterium]